MASKRAEPTADEVVDMLESGYALGKRCRQISVPVIRRVLAAEHVHVNHLLLKLAVPDHLDDTALAAAWERAVQAIVDTGLTQAWGSKSRRERICRVAKDPALLAAVQGAVAHSPNVRLDLLAVLVADGSDASIDALVPHLDPALVHQDQRLERLTKLRRHAARTPALDALFAEIDRTLEARDATSPALALGLRIGVGPVDTLWFHASFGSVELQGNVSLIQAHVLVDSRRANWFRVSLAQLGRGADITMTAFNERDVLQDELRLGRCAPAELPSWLAHSAIALKIRWDDTPHISSSLRGARRDQLWTWLMSREPRTQASTLLPSESSTKAP